MKCPFCAEDIQEAAILCRFCGAEKRNGQWFPPARPVARVVRPKGALTIQIAGVFFALSAVYSLINLTSDVPLVGAMRGGLVAIGYNLAYVSLYGGLAIGLIAAKPWGFSFALWGTVFYTFDRTAFLFDTNGRQAYLAANPLTPQLTGLIDLSLLDQGICLATLGSLVCWWGFVAYLWVRRAWFAHRPARGPLAS